MPHTPIYAAGFNCAKARTLIEQLICKDKRLSSLDDKLNAVYKATLATSGGTSQLRYEQKSWNESVRDACANLDCLYRVYNERINDLSSRLSPQERSSESRDSNGSFDVPLVETGGVYEVPILLNGVLRINFIIDSGASDVTISPDVALTLIRTGTVAQNDWIPGQVYRFADGSTAQSARFILQSLQIGNRTLRNVRCGIANSIEAPMLLGQSALSKLGRYEVDYKRGVLRIR